MLIEVKNLKKYFKIKRNAYLKAVDDVSFSIEKGETLGLVGESGCGKSTLGRTLIGLYEPTDGSIIYNGEDIAHLNRKRQREYTKKIQMIYQDPFASLDPRMTIGDIVAEGLRIHKVAKKDEISEIVYSLLERVGLSKEHANRFPHEFSGGQRQRIGIARALAIEPELIICDEPISALDVSIQAQVINLLEDLQKERNLTYLFIAHDINMVAHISDRIAVMYLGSLMELAESDTVMKNPLHPYSQALLSAAPFADPVKSRNRQRIRLTGDVPSPINAGAGCKFASRCKQCKKICTEQTPQLREVEPGHFVACHNF